MGFFDDDIIEEVKAEFTPLELNEGNVQGHFQPMPGDGGQQEGSE